MAAYQLAVNIAGSALATAIIFISALTIASLWTKANERKK